SPAECPRAWRRSGAGRWRASSRSARRSRAGAALPAAAASCTAARRRACRRERAPWRRSAARAFRGGELAGSFPCDLFLAIVDRHLVRIEHVLAHDALHVGGGDALQAVEVGVDARGVA